MADEQTYPALGIREQEYEQLQTALETAETEIQILVQENRQIQKERADALSENARLRHLLAQSHARLLEAQAAAAKSIPRAISGLEGELSVVNEELQISLEELQVTADELEEANAALLRSNERLNSRSPNVPGILRRPWRSGMNFCAARMICCMRSDIGYAIAWKSS